MYRDRLRTVHQQDSPKKHLVLSAGGSVSVKLVAFPPLVEQKIKKDCQNLEQKVVFCTVNHLNTIVFKNNEQQLTYNRVLAKS